MYGQDSSFSEDDPDMCDNPMVNAFFRKTKLTGSEEVKNILKKTTPKLRTVKRKIDRKMTSHIGTRNYRAPEVILLQKNYSYEVDNWSVG